MAVLLTDIAHFSGFAQSANLASVEGVLDSWERAHREVASLHSGVVRAVIADAFVITFELLTQAVEVNRPGFPGGSMP